MTRSGFLGRLFIPKQSLSLRRRDDQIRIGIHDATIRYLDGLSK